MLNDDLYDQLKGIFGEVRIANLGEPLIIKPRRGTDGKMHPWKLESGEQYRVCCPCCGDTRFRLYINYAYGLDKKSGFPSSKLVVCHNERCHENDNRDAGIQRNAIHFLEHALGRGYLSRAKRGLVIIQKPDPGSVQPKVDMPFPKPEWCVPVNELPYAHAARRYLESRSFDLNVLANKWGLVFCHTYPVRIGDKDYSWLADRIFIPTPGKGWQARAIGGDPKFKYFTKPGWKKSACLYGAVSARKYPFVLITEGVTDVWRIDGPGVALFGKSASSAQIKSIYRNWDTAVILLDPDASTDKYNTTMKLIRSLTSLMPKVCNVQLPGSKDPADCTHSFLWDIIEQEATKAGFPNVRRDAI